MVDRVVLKGALWNSGAVIRARSPGPIPQKDGSKSEVTASRPERMIFGRPVEPPETGAFHDAATCVSRGSSPWPSASSGRVTAPGRSGPSPVSATITAAGSPSSRIAASSWPVIRGDSTCGDAPAL
jgi:hypothetical protein